MKLQSKLPLPWGELSRTGRSMLGAVPLPLEYGRIETTTEALDAAVPPSLPEDLRLTIIWDNPTDSLELDRVLDMMRATGAAFVLKVERVKR